MGMAYLPKNHYFEYITEKQAWSSPIFSLHPTLEPYFVNHYTESPRAPATKAIHYLTLSRGFLALLWTPYIALSTADRATQEFDSVAISRDTRWPGENATALGDR